MPNQLNVGNYFITQSVATPTVPFGGHPTLKGLGVPPQVRPLLTDLAFEASGRGVFPLTQPGRFPRGSRMPGVQGTMRIDFTLAANGTGRTIAYLAPQVVSPTQYIKVGIDTSNRPTLTIKDVAGTTVALVSSPSYPALPQSGLATIHLVWDSRNVVVGARHALLRVEVPGRDVTTPDANWATDPTSEWVHFTPEYLVVGASLGDADFNGVVNLVQMACTVQT